MFKNIKTIQDFQKLLLLVFSILILITISLLLVNTAKAQSVVVNSYFNDSDVRNEWTELLVVDDNVDMRGYTLRDNNQYQTSWQTPITFKNIPFWNNMRAGTIIIIWHRSINSSSITNPEDVDKTDGYIQISAQNTSYFNGGTFGSSPSWGGASLNIAANGDIIQLRDASGNHIHALGHRSTTGSNWDSLPPPKLNHASSANSGDAIYVCPGGNITQYNGPSGNTLTSISTTTTRGLPNICISSTNDNENFIRGLREPNFTSQTVSASTSPTYPTVALTFSWNAATDPFHSDSTQGYMIVRSNTGIFGTPEDGKTYNIGDPITGGGTVIDNIDNPGTGVISYTDYDANNSNTYCYRVYAYRFKTDNLNGNSFNSARGRAYNTINFVTVTCVSNPLPVTTINFNVKKENNKSIITWTTLNEINNDYFIIERSIDGKIFEKINKAKGAGNSNQIINYQIIDNHPEKGINYYRLKQVDFDGTYSYSEIKVIKFENNSEIGIYYNENHLYIKSNESLVNTSIEIYDIRGRLVTTRKIISDNKEEKIEIPYLLENGIYFASVRNTVFQKFIKFITTK